MRLQAPFAGIAAGSMLFVGTPQIIDTWVRGIPPGETRTVLRMRRELARQHECDATCPVSTAIFLRICAEASWEQLQQGQPLQAVAPFWRVVEPGSTLARKLPVDGDWIARQRALEAAGSPVRRP